MYHDLAMALHVCDFLFCRQDALQIHTLWLVTLKLVLDCPNGQAAAAALQMGHQQNQIDRRAGLEAAVAHLEVQQERCNGQEAAVAARGSAAGAWK